MVVARGAALEGHDEHRELVGDYRGHVRQDRPAGLGAECAMSMDNFLTLVEAFSGIRTCGWCHLTHADEDPTPLILPSSVSIAVVNWDCFGVDLSQFRTKGQRHRVRGGWRYAQTVRLTVAHGFPLVVARWYGTADDLAELAATRFGFGPLGTIRVGEVEVVRDGLK